LLQEPSKVDRRQSFQDYRTFRDKFVGRLEFKDTLRRTTTPNDEPRKPTTASDRSSLRDLRTAHHPGRGRPHSGGDVRDFVGERSGGYLIETDFDFRSPPSTRDSSRDRSHYARPYEGSGGGGGSRGTPRRGQEQIYATPARRQKEAEAPVYSSSVVVRRGRDQPEELLTSTTAPSRRSENGDGGSGGPPLRRKELKVVISEPQSPGDYRYPPGSDYAEPLSPTTPKDPLR
jgi:hypothetical protein